MANTVEPPILMSRILAFVFVATIAIVVTLFITINKMIPLDRPEIFFLFDPMSRSTALDIKPMLPNKTQIDTYKKLFIREYVKARNELHQNSTKTSRSWNEIIKPWSTQEVFLKLQKTALYNEYAFENKTPYINCTVEFPRNAVSHMINSEDYYVTFVWNCTDENSGRQLIQKNYTIQVGITSDAENTAETIKIQREKLQENPLGIRVSKYMVEGGTGDPLDSTENLGL